MTKRQEYNIQQAFIRLKRELKDETMEFKVKEIKWDRIVIDFISNGNWRTTILYKSEMRTIKDIYRVFMNII